MHRDIDGADVHFNNTFDVAVLQVGQSGIVAKQEGHTGVVVLEVQGRTHSFWGLIHKAEDAFVAAAHLFIHQIGLKLQTQIIVFAFAHQNRTQLLRLIVEKQLQMDVCHIEAVVKNINDGILVDTDQHIARLNARFCCRTARNDTGDLYCHVKSLLPVKSPITKKQRKIAPPLLRNL